ncbi:hypothetical protein FSP39_002506 [Pinctada imbricata]|uniref:B box-type domain-containing protein n=1 Tax=Pinctada imbricata TaxID=66713 RepID=A0AA88XE65_PINIB|nr:hypothetical protein FSP39_002506 [Pinctada imbricata]
MAEKLDDLPSFEVAPILHQTHVECDGCEDDVTVEWYCVTCKANLCDICKRAKVHRHHTIKAWQDDGAVHARQEATSPCKIHQDHIYVTYCKTCETLCCGICVSETHSEHKFETIHTISEEKKRKLGEYLKELKSELLPLSRRTKEGLEMYFETGRSTSRRNKEKIAKKISELHTQLDAMKIKLTKAEEDKFMSFSEDIQYKLARIDAHIPFVEAEIKRTETQINTFSRIEFIQHVLTYPSTSEFVPPNDEEPLIQDFKETGFRIPDSDVAVGIWYYFSDMI